MFNRDGTTTTADLERLINDPLQQVQERTQALEKNTALLKIKADFGNRLWGRFFDGVV